MGKTFLQVRADENDKEQAAAILEQLGTNISSVVNMLLKQIVLTNGIPFEVRIPGNYTMMEKLKEVKATMAMENMDLNDEDMRIIEEYQNSSNREQIRSNLIADYMVKNNE